MNKTVVNKEVKGNVIERLSIAFNSLEFDERFEKEFNEWIKANNII